MKLSTNYFSKTIFLGPLFFLLIALGLYFTNTFRKLGITKGPDFMDLRLVTTAADCMQHNSSWNLLTPTCDPWGRPFNYPVIWVRIFYFLHLGETITSYLGILLIFLLFLCFTFYSSLLLKKVAPKSWQNNIFILCLVSPPILLLSERGNTDIIIFILITVSFYLLTRGKFIKSSIVIGFISTLKFYPIPLIILVSQKVGRLKFILISGILILVVVLTSYKDAPLIAARSATWYTHYGYGITTVPVFVNLWWYGSFKYGLIYLQSYICLIITLFLILILNKNSYLKHSFIQIIEQFRIDPVTSNCFLVGALPFMFSFLIGVNFDMRLILLLPSLVALLSLQRQSLVSLVLIGLIIFHLFNSFIFPTKISLISDGLMFFTVILFAFLSRYLLRFNLIRK